MASSNDSNMVAGRGNVSPKPLASYLQVLTGPKPPSPEIPNSGNQHEPNFPPSPQIGRDFYTPSNSGRDAIKIGSSSIPGNRVNPADSIGFSISRHTNSASSYEDNFPSPESTASIPYRQRHSRGFSRFSRSSSPGNGDRSSLAKGVDPDANYAFQDMQISPTSTSIINVPPPPMAPPSPFSLPAPEPAIPSKTVQWPPTGLLRKR